MVLLLELHGEVVVLLFELNGEFVVLLIDQHGEAVVLLLELHGKVADYQLFASTLSYAGSISKGHKDVVSMTWVCHKLFMPLLREWNPVEA